LEAARAWPLRVMPPTARDAEQNAPHGVAPTRADAVALVRAGVLAPSADNHHVVLFEIGADEIRLVARPDFRSAPAHRKVLGWLAVGAIVETMRVQAPAYGVQLQCQWFPHGVEGDVVASLRFTPTDASPDAPRIAAIGRRHTNRRVPFRGPGLTDAQRGELDREVARIEGVQLAWLTGQARKDVLQLVAFAEAQRFLLQPLHAELFESIRFDLGWQRAADEGLAPGSLAIEPPMRPLFALLRHWPVMRALQRVGAHKLIGMRAAYWPCRLAPELAVLSTTLGSTQGPLAVGQALQRVWLAATVQGFSLQPFAAPGLLALPEYTDVPRAAREHLARGWSRIVPAATPLMVFRLGHAAPMKIVNARRPLEDYLRDPEPAH
jgi:hypothetical protein